MADEGYDWTDEGEKAVYRQAVLDCLDDRRLSELLELRPVITREVVVEAMCSSPRVARMLGNGVGSSRSSAHSLYRTVHVAAAPYRWMMPESRSPRELFSDENFTTWALLAVGGSVGGVFFLRAGAWWASTIYSLVVLLLLLGLPLRGFVRRVVHALPAAEFRHRRRRGVQSVVWSPWVFPLWVAEKTAEARWVGQLGRDDLHKEVTRAVEELLGEDVGTLLVPSTYDGLSSPRHSSYFVESGPSAELARKMGQLSGGTIALSGPRGVGKTTLMEHGVRDGDFAVFAHAPAAYAPYDFLTSLFVSVCRQYVSRAGYDAPEFVRLSYLHRTLRRATRPLGRLRTRLAYVLPAAVVVAIGLPSVTRWLLDEDQRRLTRRYLAPGWDRTVDFFGDVSTDRVPLATVSFAFLAMLLWVVPQLRSAASWLRRPVKALLSWGVFSFTFGPLLFLLTFKDGPWQALLFAPWLLCCLVAIGTETSPPLRIGRWTMSTNWIWGPLAVLLPCVFLERLFTDRTARALLVDADGGARIYLFLLGMLFLLLPQRSWSVPRRAPGLVTTCRNHLYRLQTTQSSSAALTTGAAQLFALGSGHTTSVTTVPPNYPALVGEFRQLLADIGQDEYAKGNRVVVAIDEVDRLGSDSLALAFLAEIKAILGVPHVHYLISVAEDVGAAFVRRGLPHRDVTDSSLDDVVHVARCSLAESAEILRKRAPGIGEAYIVLAHALSGGIPRDLIRYGRRLLEIRLVTEQAELPDISQALIIEELSETLAGFRTLLAKQQWTPGTQGVLGSFRSLAAHLRVACPCPEPVQQLRGALAHFVAYEAEGLPENSRGLIDEAAVYAYLSLTLLDIFGGPGFTQRRTEAARLSPDGNPDLLAEARQELAVSPYSTRPLIDGIRRAWQLDPVSAQGPRPAVMIPPPRGTACTAGHHPGI
ncbi:hypothetical protein R6V09_06860 [Streptomyces sp. W16]|uniref:hypothetical protein n=1 Tax=Streptomyces sp. W16 TaxID=3076631 RepID=UPI00295C1B00|nr:hypothetical protein [Streptomyces sp. W16]MDV9169857.1 hypothetical protein [Streptomyces sp. W16]